MEILIPALLIIVIIFIGANYLKNQKNQRNIELKIGDFHNHLQDLYTKLENDKAALKRDIHSNIEHFSHTHSEILVDKFDAFNKSLEVQLSQHTEKVNSKITSSLNSYLIQEDEEIKEWTKLIAGENNTATAIYKLETALNKFPSCLELIQLFADRITPLLLSTDSNVQKRAIERYNRATRIFLDNCAPQHWEEAKEMYEDALTLGNLFMKEQVQGFEETAERAIRELEEIVKSDILDVQQMKRVEELDKQLSKEVLKSFNKLNTRYQTVTQKLFKQITPEADNVVVEDYNLRALEEFKKASNLFNSDMQFYKTRAGLKELAYLLGAWDQKHLTPAIQIYFQSVYSDVFSKLEPIDKPLMTELMLKAEKEPVFA